MRRERSWESLTAVLDDAILELTNPGAGMAVVAIGGYGRRQQCFFSDIDLMLVVAEPITDAPPVFRALWDAGLAVGHAVRTPREAHDGAIERSDTLCSLLDTRLIGGDEALFEELLAAVGRAVRPARLRGELLEEERQRRREAPHHLQGLDLKTGRGGLRSLQAIRWLDGLELLDDRDVATQVPELEDQLLEARQALHAATRRRRDLLEFSVREPAARWAGAPQEEFLSRTFGTVRRVDSLVTAALGDEIAVQSSAGVGGRIFRAVRSRIRSTSVDTSNPWQLAAQAVARAPEHPDLTEEEEARITAAAATDWTDAARDAFVQLAGAGAAGRQVFDTMTDLGYLQAALPEWSHVVARPQLDPFHLHPVDDHLWRTAAEVVALSSSDEEPWTRDVAEELGSLDEVVLGALFHDIGKGTGRDHSEAGAEMFREFGERAGYGPITVDVVSLLVRRHLLLPQVATRHDLDDPAVVAEVAEVIGDADVLRMLYLLTIADARATGPDVWTPWRASLIRTLFGRTMQLFESGRPRTPPLRRARIDEVTERLSEEIPAEQISRHLAAMPDTYTLRTPASEVRRHLLLLTPLPAGDDVRIDVVEAAEWSDVVLTTRDRAGLLSLVSGVMALSNVSILEARLATRADGVVVDRFHVVDSLQGGAVPPSRWATVLSDLRSALAGELPLEERLSKKHWDYRALVDESVEPEVRIIAGADHGDHRIELRGADRVGLLHDVARALHELEVDVRFAKIDTQGDRVVDTFHVFIPDGLDQEVLAAGVERAARVPD